MDQIEILIPITMFACAFGIAYIFLSTRHRERMAMIEKGADPSMFRMTGRRNKFTLKFGLLFVGMAVGILLGEFLHIGMGMREEVANFSMIFLWGGLALILSHYLENKQHPGQDQNPFQQQGKQQAPVQQMVP
jgi:hypothetical protein